jgi:HEAT repeat protein
MVLMLCDVCVCAATAAAADGDMFATASKEAAQTLPKRLEARDQTELIMLLDELGPGPDADRTARTISEFLNAGQTDVVTDHALDCLARLGSREAREVLTTFTKHRRPEARMRAYTALAKLKDARDVNLLAEGLRDSAPEVRENAARLLGEAHARDATETLLRALSAGVRSAAGALGKVGDAGSVDRFGAALGHLPLAIMLEGYGNYLERPDLPDPVKLHIIASLEEVSGAVVKDFLIAQLQKPLLANNPKLKQAIEATASRIRVAPPAAGGRP